MNKKQIREIQEFILRDEFDSWKQGWYDTIPKCRYFDCCHELMSCGINVLCGDCTIYNTWKNRKSNVNICKTVDCMDCIEKYSCKKLKDVYKGQNEAKFHARYYDRH